MPFLSIIRMVVNANGSRHSYNQCLSSSYSISAATVIFLLQRQIFMTKTFMATIARDVSLVLLIGQSLLHIHGQRQRRGVNSEV